MEENFEVCCMHFLQLNTQKQKRLNRMKWKKKIWK